MTKKQEDKNIRAVIKISFTKKIRKLFELQGVCLKFNFMEIFDILTACVSEFQIVCANESNGKPLVKQMQALSSQNFDYIQDKEDFRRQVMIFLQNLWTHQILLEDCILVSGLIFSKLYQSSSSDYNNLLEIARIEDSPHREWVSMSILRGIIFSNSSGRSEDLKHLVQVTLCEIDTCIIQNRSVLISRHLENLLSLFAAEEKLLSYDHRWTGQQIVLLVSRTVRLKADLVDYKSRDLVKWHLSHLQAHGSDKDKENFASAIMECLPEKNKVSLQIFSAICSVTLENSCIYESIFRLSLPCLAYT